MNVNVSNQKNLLKMAIDEGCKTIGDLAKFIKEQPSLARA